jgi:hypothetical protein
LRRGERDRVERAGRAHAAQGFEDVAVGLFGAGVGGHRTHLLGLRLVLSS